MAIDNFVKNYLFSIISVDSLIDQLVEMSVVIRTSKVGNTTVVVVFGLVCFCLDWFGLVWYGVVWFGMDWFGKAFLSGQPH